MHRQKKKQKKRKENRKKYNRIKRKRKKNHCVCKFIADVTNRESYSSNYSYLMIRFIPSMKFPPLFDHQIAVRRGAVEPSFVVLS